MHLNPTAEPLDKYRLNPDRVVIAEPVTLYETLVAYTDALRRQRRSPNTLRHYDIYVTGFVRFLHDQLGMERPTLAHLTPTLVGKYQDHIRGRAHRSTGGARRDGAVAEKQAVLLLKAFTRWLWRHEFFEVDPLARLEVPRVTRLHLVPFSKTDCLRLLEAAQLGPDPILERALLLLSLDTGCRIGELCSATLADLDLEQGTILFRRTKNGRPRRVFFRVAGRPDGGPCTVALMDWLAERDKRAEGNVHTLLVDREGRSITTSKARRIYRALGEFAGVEHAHPHKSRHTHASEFLSELPGAELHLRNRMGHISPDVLESYVTISDGMARQVADSASVSAKWGL